MGLVILIIGCVGVVFCLFVDLVTRGNADLTPKIGLLYGLIF